MKKEWSVYTISRTLILSWLNQNTLLWSLRDVTAPSITYTFILMPAPHPRRCRWHQDQPFPAVPCKVFPRACWECFVWQHSPSPRSTAVICVDLSPHLPPVGELAVPSVFSASPILPGVLASLAFFPASANQLVAAFPSSPLAPSCSPSTPKHLYYLSGL